MNHTWHLFSKRLSKILFNFSSEPEETIECPGVWEENDGSKYCFVISKADWDLAEVNLLSYYT